MEGKAGGATGLEMTSTPTASTGFTSGQVKYTVPALDGNNIFTRRYKIILNPFCISAGRVSRHVATPNHHVLAAEDVVSCCLDLSVPSISFRINGHPVQGMFENFNLDSLFFPVVSFSAGVK